MLVSETQLICIKNQLGAELVCDPTDYSRIMERA